MTLQISRARFLELVDQAFGRTDLSDEEERLVRAELMPVARWMSRFPLNSWINHDIGYGSLVGEYVIDRLGGPDDRAGAMRAIMDVDRKHARHRVKIGPATIRELLGVGENPLAGPMLRVGAMLDLEMETEVGGRDRPGRTSCDVVEIVDD